MKHINAIVIASALASFAFAAPQSVKVSILTGQSNMEGGRLWISRAM